MKREELINYLLRLSEAKFLLMKNLLDSTYQQKKALETDEVEELNNLIQQKQAVMNKVDVLDKEFVEKYSILKKELKVENLQEVKEEISPEFKLLKEKISEIVKVIEEIKQLDGSNTEEVRNNIEKAKNSLKTIRNGKKAVLGYNSHYKEAHALFIDKKK